MARILVIDDQLHIRNIIQELLSIDGHEVDLAEDGKVGLKLIGLNPYDLVITDIVMPEKDGIEVLTELKRRSLQVRLIVMTGGGTMLDIGNLLTMAKLLGADRVLTKPLDFEKLKVAVKEVLALER